MIVLTGDEFNKLYNGRQFIKLTNKKEIHGDLELSYGLNIDPVPLDTINKCSSGIYFCNIRDYPLFMTTRSGQMVHMRNVTVPPDAKVCIEGNKFKADRLILGDKHEIDTLLNIPEFVKRYVKSLDN